MKFSNILLVSIKNIINKKGAYFKILMGFFLVFLINFTIIFYSGSLSSVYSSYENSNVSNAVIRVLYTLSNEQILEIRNSEQIASMCFGTAKYYGDSESMVDIVIGDHNHKTDINYNGTISVFYVSPNSDTQLTENYEKEFTEKTGENPIKLGRNMQKENEIIISETILEKLNITPEYALGKSISIESSEGEINATVCGVLDKRLQVMHLTFFDIVCYQSQGVANNYFDISVKKFKGNELLLEKVGAIIPENEGVFFWFGDYIAEKMALVEAQEELCSKFLTLMSGLVFVVMCVYVAYNQFYLISKNSIFYGILKVNGVSNKNIFIIHFLELFLLCLLALFWGLVCSIGIFGILQFIMSGVFSIIILFPYLTLIWSIPVFVGVGLILSCLLSLYVYQCILKRPPIYLLKLEQ